MPKIHGVRQYNKTNICDRCKKEKLAPGKARREYKCNEWTEKWLCNKCGLKDDYKERYLTDYKINNLSIESAPGKGRIFEQITCKARGIENLNIENDNFHSPIDHSKDPVLGIIQTKGTVITTIYSSYEGWPFTVENEHKKEFDFLILYCMSKDMMNVERVYIIPWEEVIIRSTIKIMKINSNRGWYTKYRVDEKLYNNAFHNLDNKDLKGLRRK